MNFVINFLKNLGKISSSVGTNACISWFVDEPKCPKSLLK